jgi:hydroxyacylglutathione hydrolase
VVIDPAEAEPVLAEAAKRGWRIGQIWNTHWHPDHTGGNAEIQAATGCTITGPAAEAARIPTLDRQVREGDRVRLGALEAEVLEVPAHTAGHIAYHFASEQVIFVGDTLFAMGCGRLFEGTPGQMWSSLGKILAWPDDTRLFCAHEYTQSNARFALTVEPHNEALIERAREVERLRAASLPTIPTTVGVEKATNPFLRAASADLRRTIGLVGADEVEVFAKTRALKDVF